MIVRGALLDNHNNERGVMGEKVNLNLKKINREVK